MQNCKKSTIKNVTILFILQKSQFFVKKFQKIVIQKFSIIKFFFSIITINSTCKIEKKINRYKVIRFIWIANFYCNIKTKIRICHDFWNDYFIEKIAFFNHCIKNCIKIDKKQINSMIYDFVAIVFIFSNVWIKTSKNFYLKIFKHLFVFLIILSI